MARKSRVFTEADYQTLLKDVHKANQAIQRLTNKYGERSWATIGLYNKLEDKNILGLTRYGNIRVNRSMSDIKLKYIEKATREFLSSKTSTIRGAEKTIKETKESLKAHFGDDENKTVLSDEEVGRLYNIVSNKEWRDMTQEFDPSETWARLVRAKEQNLSYDKFANLFSKDANINDLDIKEYLKEIYDMYMK